jgi:hypothetical protein
MQTVAAVFRARSDAERGVAELRSLNIAQDRINLLTPEATAEELAAIPKTDAEQPGIIKTLGAVVGGMTGFAGGYGLAVLALPGLGLVLAFGAAGGMILGAVGAIAGWAVGSSVETALSEGLPGDELFFYEDALRQGRSVVIALLDGGPRAEAARGALEKAGAETIDRARDKWWIGLRSVEKEHYDVHGGNFERDELWFRRGFEVALDPISRGKSYQESRAAHRAVFPDLYDESAEGAFRHGYERGQVYLQLRGSRNGNGN